MEKENNKAAVKLVLNVGIGTVFTVTVYLLYCRTYSRKYTGCTAVSRLLLHESRLRDGHLSAVAEDQAVVDMRRNIQVDNT